MDKDSLLKKYIDNNTLKKQQATNVIEKNFHQLLNNAYFGKCIESVRKRVNIVLVESKKRQQFQVYKPGFKRFEIFDENLVGVKSIKPVVQLDKPIYVGVAILEISKLIMYEFYYILVKRKWPDATFCFTDTDSLLLVIPTEDLYEECEGKPIIEFVGLHSTIVNVTV